MVFECIWWDSTIVYDVQHNETWLSNEPNAVQTKKCCSMLQPLLSTYPSQNSGSPRTDAWCHHATVAREQRVEFVVSWILDLILTALETLLGSILLIMCSDSYTVSVHKRLWHKRWAHFAANLSIDLTWKECTDKWEFNEDMVWCWRPKSGDVKVWKRKTIYHANMTPELMFALRQMGCKSFSASCVPPVPPNLRLINYCWIVLDSGFGVAGCFRFRWCRLGQLRLQHVKDDVEEKKKHFEKSNPFKSKCNPFLHSVNIMILSVNRDFKMDLDLKLRSESETEKLGWGCPTVGGRREKLLTFHVHVLSLT